MEVALLVARLVLAAVFVVAGVDKLAEPRSLRKAVADFGVPAPLAAPLGILLPLVELAVAAGLSTGRHSLVGCGGGVRAPAGIRGGDGAPTWPVAAGRSAVVGQLHSEPRRLEDPRAQRGPRRCGRLRGLAGLGRCRASPVSWLPGFSQAPRVRRPWSLGAAVLAVLAPAHAVVASSAFSGRMDGLVVALENAQGAGSGTRPRKDPVPEAAPDFELHSLRRRGAAAALESAWPR